MTTTRVAGFHENWNRYYDPTTGRYLQPEPLLQAPDYAVAMARVGMATPTYAYANNNPLTYIDPDGRTVVCVQFGFYFWVCSRTSDKSGYENVKELLSFNQGMFAAPDWSGTMVRFMEDKFWDDDRAISKQQCGNVIEKNMMGDPTRRIGAGRGIPVPDWME